MYEEKLCVIRYFVLLLSVITKISCVLRMLWLVSCCVYIRLCKHGCDVTACFPVLFCKRNRKWTSCVYITWRKNSREFGRILKYLQYVYPLKRSLMFASGYINTGSHFVFLKDNWDNSDLNHAVVWSCALFENTCNLFCVGVMKDSVGYRETY